MSRILGIGAAAVVLATAPLPPAAFAELQTVTADQVTTLAKPLKVQTVNKNRVWLLFVLGASSLFGVTVLAENNEAWFPAIARANKAMAASAVAAKKRAEEAPAFEGEEEEEDVLDEEEQLQFEERLLEVQQERKGDVRLESAVAAGLAGARRPSLNAAAAAAAVVDVESSSVGDDAAAAVKETYPLNLSVEEENEAAAAEEEDDEEADIDGVASSSSSEASVVVAAEEMASSEGTNRAAPLFEIGVEQIEASSKNFQQRVLNDLSVEDLQRELEQRAAAAAAAAAAAGSPGNQ